MPGPLFDFRSLPFSRNNIAVVWRRSLRRILGSLFRSKTFAMWRWPCLGNASRHPRRGRRDDRRVLGAGKHVTAWIDTRKDAATRELLHKVAEEGFAYVESTFKNLKGSLKLDEAISYVNRHLKQHGIELSTQEIQAAIGKAVQEHNVKVKL